MRFFILLSATVMLLIFGQAVGLPIVRSGQDALDKPATFQVHRQMYLLGTSIHDELADSAKLETPVYDKALEFLKGCWGLAAACFERASLGVTPSLGLKTSSAALPPARDSSLMVKRQNDSCGNDSQCGTGNTGNQGGSGNTVSSGGSSGRNLALDLGLGIGIGLPGALGALFGIYLGCVSLKDRKKKKAAKAARGKAGQQGLFSQQQNPVHGSSPMEQHYYGRNELPN